jgi:uncharacterized coiled-coil DUF342 family protein
LSKDSEALKTRLTEENGGLRTQVN